jgi:outer membrane lipoprotein-sorting protein
LTRDFDVSMTDPPPDTASGSRALKLVPKTPQPDYESLVLSVDPKTLALRGLLAVDGQGGTSSFAFTNLRENVGVPDQRFVFAVPRGVEVVKDSGKR